MHLPPLFAQSATGRVSGSEQRDGRKVMLLLQWQELRRAYGEEPVVQQRRQSILASVAWRCVACWYPLVALLK